ncbi:MAG: TlpA family protein disulfide reductase [Acidimicrobiia bacterium]|nr:TlpA family protein disulfide reductase [Acidimicrobiia bacterium]
MKLHARPVTFVVTVLLVMGIAALPAAAAKQDYSPHIKVQGSTLPEPDDTFGSVDDPAIGETPPTLVGEGFNGQPVTVEHGSAPRIVIFVAHWCPHCQAEVPEIVKLAKNGKLDGVEVDTIATNTSADLPNYPPFKWLKREKWPFKPVMVDDKRSRALVAMGGNSFPYFVFVAADGTVAWRTSGELPPDLITDIAARLVAGQPILRE